jgi:hypothetical protein
MNGRKYMRDVELGGLRYAAMMEELDERRAQRRREAWAKVWRFLTGRGASVSDAKWKKETVTFADGTTAEALSKVEDMAVDGYITKRCIVRGIDTAGEGRMMKWRNVCGVPVRFIRRNLQCRIGIHWDVTDHDEDGGLCGAGTCNDCGESWDAIEWPRIDTTGRGAA